MNPEDRNPSEAENPEGLSDERLKPQIERLRSLRSAWGALAPSCLTAQARKVSENGRAVTELLVVLSGRVGELSEIDLVNVDHRLNDFESMMQKMISQVPVSQFRSSLPGLIRSDRQSLLDLLDTMIAATDETKIGLSLRIGAIDYLITLLCTNAGASGGQVRFDPVTLTARIAALCDMIDTTHTTDDARLEEIEAEFFAAANMDRDDLREEMQQRILRSRKAELGMGFFAPRVLRAIVTYNASLYHRITDEILDSGDWGLIQQGIPDSSSAGETGTSVFDCRAFRTIASAARRRAQGEDALPSNEDRIVWSLDFDYLDKSELKALTHVSVGTREDVLGTAILVGLLCRSLAVLSIELQAVEIAPDLVSDVWVRELEAVFQEEINHKIASDAYKAACALSELKNKFLFAPLTDQYREQRQATPTPAASSPKPAAPTEAAQPRAAEAAAPLEPHRKTSPKNLPPKRETALDLVRSALEDEHATATKSQAKRSAFDPAVLKPIGLAGLVIVLLMSFALSNRNPDLKRWSSDQLESVSPYLDSGRRNGEGNGPAFVGQIAKEWENLPLHVREASGDDLVRRLRDIGIEQIMIYGSGQRVRIQSIGSQATQIR